MADLTLDRDAMTLTPALKEAIDIGKRFHQKGKIAGLRRAAELLVQWGATARETGDEFEGKCNEEAAESLRQIADRLEEEG